MLWFPKTNLSNEAPEGNSWLPVFPHPNLNLSWVNTELDSMNCSSVIFHAAAKDGKMAYLLFSPNLVEPSRRKVAVNKYRSRYFNPPRKKVDCNSFVGLLNEDMSLVEVGE